MYFDPEEFGKRLAEQRKLRGLTQEAAAEALNISLVYWRMLEHGKRNCAYDLLIAIACYFNVSTDYLMTGKKYQPVEERKEERTRLLAAISELIDIAQKY